MRLLPLFALLVLVTGCRAARPWHIEATDSATLRTLAQGQLLGGAGRYGSDAWLGVPFAKPPVGERRWRKPEPPEPWQGVREATHVGYVCPHADDGLNDGDEPSSSEDCLTLSVWAPRLAPAEVVAQKLPVMVWIHGGGNSIGDVAFFEGGHLAAEQRVLVVALQYRLGPLGWFRHPALREGADALDASGNFGTLDLVRGLQWVRENAAAFGGDPSNVTIFGESAGALDVYSLLVCPLARGLFHRAIAQSGDLDAARVEQAEAPEAQGGHHNSSAEVVARLLLAAGRATSLEGARTLNTSLEPAVLAAFLRGLSPTQLIAGYDGARVLGMLDAPLLFREGVVLPKADWLEVFDQPDGWNRVPVIAGTNLDESRVFLFLDATYVRRVLGLLPRLRDEANFTATGDALSRFWKLKGVDLPLLAMRRSGARDLYAYRWDWRDEPVILGTDLSVMMGASHGLEQPFVLGHFDMPGLNALWSDENRPGRESLSRVMRKLWADFARGGAPGPRWKPLDPEGDTHLVLNVGQAQMRPLLEDAARIIGDVLVDPRLPTAKARCALLQQLVRERSVSPQQYEGLEPCRAFSLER